MAIADQVIKGNITGSGPENYEERARLMEAVDAEGNPLWRPNSIRIAGRWFDHSALGPISSRMGSIANLKDEAEDYANKPAPRSAGDHLLRTWPSTWPSARRRRSARPGS